MYNTEKKEPIGIMKAIKYITPYFAIIAASWLILIIFWYLTKLPIGPGVYPIV